jgi:hypothetical protein
MRLRLTKEYSAVVISIGVICFAGGVRWLIILGVPLLYMALALKQIVLAVQTVHSQPAQVIEQRQMDYRDIERRLESLESLHLEAALATVTAADKARDDKLTTLISLSVFVLGGLVLVLGLQVFKLVVEKQVRSREGKE